MGDKENSKYSDWQAGKEKASLWFQALRDEICEAISAFEAEDIHFSRKKWQREKNGGGGEISLLNGEVFEKAGVNISTVYGELSEDFAAHIPGTEQDRNFWASGISVIIHPRNPHIPIVHMNTRLIITGKAWFGGGADLTPHLSKARNPEHEDAKAFHKAMERACAKYDFIDYEHLKKWCDRYFYLPHRNEPRGIGGIFYDNMDDDFEACFAFSKDVGKAFLEVYPQIVARRKDTPYGEAERNMQLKQRGRYIEFNLLHDRGTLFGLKTGGNIEAIFSSLPPLASWE